MAAADPTAHALILVCRSQEPGTPAGTKPPRHPTAQRRLLLPSTMHPGGARCLQTALLHPGTLTPLHPDTLMKCMHAEGWCGQEEEEGCRVAGCKQAHQGPVPPQPACTMAGILGTSSASCAKPCQLPCSPIPLLPPAPTLPSSCKEYF